MEKEGICTKRIRPGTGKKEKLQREGTFCWTGQGGYGTVEQAWGGKGGEAGCREQQRLRAVLKD